MLVYWRVLVIFSRVHPFRINQTVIWGAASLRTPKGLLRFRLVKKSPEGATEHLPKKTTVKTSMILLILQKKKNKKVFAKKTVFKTMNMKTVRYFVDFKSAPWSMEM